MARLRRSRPRRAAGLHPVGSMLTLRDGRRFEVATEPVREWFDPSYGHGGGEWPRRRGRYHSRFDVTY